MLFEKTLDAPEIAARVRWFTIRLTIGFILAANALFLSALWVSGLDLVLQEELSAWVERGVSFARSLPPKS